MQIRFARLGWQIVFINRPPTGNAVMDAVMDTLAFAQESDYLVKLSASVKRGKAHWGQSGYWLGGPPPFPACRVEAVTRRALADGVRATERSVLEPDPAKLEHWNHGARMLLDGRTLMDVVRYFSANVPNAYPKRKGVGTHWTYGTIRKMYTNRALIGELHYRLAGEPVNVEARWPPIVDVDVFGRVNAELARREPPDARRVGRRRDSRYPLQMVRCAACGARYKGGTTAGHRYYVHYNPAEPFLRGAALDRARAAGCRTFTVPADEIERAVRDAIVAHRCEPAAAAAVLAAHAAKLRAVSDDEQQVDRLRAEVVGVEGEYANLRAALRTIRDADLRADLIADAGQVRARLEKLRFELQTATSRQAAKAGAGEGVERTIRESARIAYGWDDASLNEQQAVFDLWIENVAVAIDHDPGRRWPTAKRAFIGLADIPNELHQRRRAHREIAESEDNAMRRSALAPSASFVLNGEGYPRCRSSRARGCLRG